MDSQLPLNKISKITAVAVKQTCGVSLPDECSIKDPQQLHSKKYSDRVSAAVLNNRVFKNILGIQSLKSKFY